MIASLQLSVKFLLERGLKFLILFPFFTPLFLFSFDFSSPKLLNLHDDRYWHTLLHFRNGKSEIDDKKFFLSPDGKHDAKVELEATIKALLQDKNETVCRFPARINWLMEKLPELQNEIETPQCNKIEKIIKEFDPNYVSLIFPTAHINSPASMYGHTFLRIDSDKKTPLLSQAINYAAQTVESNGLLFAYHGLTGGYEGRYSISPYYDKVKEYNDMERRDIWEYELNLNKDEIRRLLYHYFELKDSYADYRFFTENCSYNLLWLLESARENTHLVDKFYFKAIPIDTIAAVKEAGFIKDTTYRASKSKQIKEIVKKIENKDRAKEFLQNGYKLGILKDLNDTQKAHVLDLSSQILRYKRTKNKIDKKQYISDLMKVLAQRSKLQAAPKYLVQEPIRPLAGHKTNRISLKANNDKTFLFSFKPSLHDIYDVESGYIEGSYINFFDLVLKKEKKDNIKLEKFDFINISSYSSRDLLFKPLSWEVEFGFERDRYDKLQFKLKGGVGHSYIKKGFLFYFFLNPASYYGKDVSLSISPKAGLIKNFLNLKLGLNAKREFFTNGDKVTHFETFLTYNLFKNLALNLKYDITKNEQKNKDTGTLSLFYYF